MQAEPPDEIALAYGLSAARFTPLSGGVINDVWRVDSHGHQPLVLKRFVDRGIFQVLKSIVVHRTARQNGLPVPDILLNKEGSAVTLLDGELYVLSEFIEGQVYEPGKMPERAARAMGVCLGRLHTALGSIRPGIAKPLPSEADIEAELRTLLAQARERRSNRIDAIAVEVLEGKLDLLGRIKAVPALSPAWTHGDYEWRNVLFDENDEVVGVIDFDDADYVAPARDVMRCIALTFPNLEEEAYAFFAGYAAERHLTLEDARAYVDFYRYISTYRVWPIIARYTEPASYQAHWDNLIQPFIAWDWERLADRLAGIASKADAMRAAGPPS